MAGAASDGSEVQEEGKNNSAIKTKLFIEYAPHFLDSESQFAKTVPKAKMIVFNPTEIIPYSNTYKKEWTKHELILMSLEKLKKTVPLQI